MTPSGGQRSCAVIGATGFVGREIARQLEISGWRVVPVPAPRVSTALRDRESLLAESHEHEAHVVTMQQGLRGCDVVVMAAGLATPDAPDSDALTGANALLPVLVARAAFRAGCGGILHISSAAVQGRVHTLNERETRSPFSPYSEAKALGEDAVLELGRHTGLPTCVFRATSVHGPARPATHALRRFARSPLSSVAAPGSAVTPLVSVTGLAASVVFLLDRLDVAPPIVLQPAEGATTRSVLVAAGGREPLRIPAPLARAVVAFGYRVIGRLQPRATGLVRRVELMWFGQAQEPGWLLRTGFKPVDAVHSGLERPSSVKPVGNRAEAGEHGHQG